MVCDIGLQSVHFSSFGKGRKRHCGTGSRWCTSQEFNTVLPMGSPPGTLLTNMQYDNSGSFTALSTYVTHSQHRTTLSSSYLLEPSDTTKHPLLAYIAAALNNLKAITWDCVKVATTSIILETPFNPACLTPRTTFQLTHNIMFREHL